jgi:CubicO group peptidase (beta-lactamase class C family)
MCLDDGLIKDIHTPLIDFFPNILLKQKDVRKQNLTLFHLLTMTTGFNWPEFGEWNFGTPMEFSKDIIRFIFEREIDTEPGTKMNYNSGCSNILSAIIGKVTNMNTADFAYKRLFSPLGIKDFVWHEKQNISLGANGLRMKASDMLKLGSLYLHNGKINETQLISADWISESTKPRFITYTDVGHYGYHWWTSTFSLRDKQEIPYYFAMGLFGQFIIVVPHFDVVAIFISENYGDSLKPMCYFRELIAPIFLVS